MTHVNLSKKIKQGYSITTDVTKRFFATRSAAEKFIKRINKSLPSDCQMKKDDVYMTTNEK